uniref:Uncharacterized protein n=1 Tax=Glossina pallidipes TaxID=7398 RepID=A0A1A9Z7C1_GLOPL
MYSSPSANNHMSVRQSARFSKLDSQKSSQSISKWLQSAHSIIGGGRSGDLQSRSLHSQTFVVASLKRKRSNNALTSLLVIRQTEFSMVLALIVAEAAGTVLLLRRGLLIKVN